MARQRPGAGASAILSWRSSAVLNPSVHRSLIRTAVLVAWSVCFVSYATEPVPQVTAQPKKDQWEEAIRSFQENDRRNPPPQGGVVFLGSSSFRRWELDKSFLEHGLINRGFGGFHMQDALKYLDRLVLPLKPRTIFLYEGVNDLANGKCPGTVAHESGELVQRVHGALPETKIVFVCIKPSIRRWHLIDAVRDANARIRKSTELHGLLDSVDIDAPLLGPDGRPNPECYVEDSLHLSETGYALWAERVGRHLN